MLRRFAVGACCGCPTKGAADRRQSLPQATAGSPAAPHTTSAPRGCGPAFPDFGVSVVQWLANLTPPVKPETVLRWPPPRLGHVLARRRSRRTGKPGRRPKAPELRTLIRRMTMENRLSTSCRSTCCCTTSPSRASRRSSSRSAPPSAQKFAPTSSNPKRKNQDNLRSRYRDRVARDNPPETCSKEHSQPSNFLRGSDPGSLQNRLGHHNGNRWRVVHALEEESKERTVGNAEFAPTSSRCGRRRPTSSS